MKREKQTAAARKIKTHKARARIYLTVCRARVLIDGAWKELGVLRPMHAWDQDMMRDRGYAVGTNLGAVLTQERNPKFNRLAHVIGRFVAENMKTFEGMKAHAVLKQLQREANVGCDVVLIDMPEVSADPIEVRQARSLSFDDMDEAEFQEVVSGIVRYACEKYFPEMTPEAFEELLLMYEERGPGP